MQFGMAAYAIVRGDERKAKAELERITNVSPGSPGYQNYQDWVSNTKLEQRVTLEDYSVSNRGLRPGFVGTPQYVADRIQAYREIGVDLLLLQCSPQLEEMERFAAEVIPLAGDSTTARRAGSLRPSASRWSHEETTVSSA
jgi:FMNH2-dependent dimethyl sulfone monooxygenase